MPTEEDLIKKILRMTTNDKDAIMMILAAHIDYGNHNGGLLSVSKFGDASDAIIKYFETKK